MQEVKPGAPSLEGLLLESDVTHRILAALGVAVYTTDAEGVITFYNEAAAELWGRRPEVGVDMWCGSWRILRPDGTVLPHAECPMARALKENVAVRGEEAIAERPDGSRVWFMPYPTPLQDSFGRLVGAVNVLVDITERKQAELDVLEDEQRLRELISGMGVAVYTTDAAGRVTMYNEIAAELWGRRPEIGKEMWSGAWRMLRPDGSLLPPEETPMAIALKEGRPVRGVEALVERPDGTRIWIEPTPTPLRDSSGRMVGAVNVFQDVTPRKEAEVALQKSEEEFRDFFDNSPMPLHWVDRAGRIIRANRAELNLLGYDESQYLGHHVSEFQVEPPVEMLDRLGSGEVLREYEARLRCQDGSIRDVLIDSSVLWRNGEFVHTRCFTRDITDKKLADEAVYRLSAIVESSDDAIVSKDLNGIIQSWNPGASRLFGYSAEEAIGQSIRLIIPPEHQHEEDEVLRRLRQGERVEHFETIRRRKEGTAVPISLSVSPLRDDRGRVIGASKIARDITERKQAEEEMRAAGALKDQFLSLVSHELRTPISTVLANALILSRRGAQVAEADRLQALQDIASEAERLQRVVENLLLLTRLEASRGLEFEPLDIEEVLCGPVAAFRHRNPGRTVDVVNGVDGARVQGQQELLEMVIDNLLSNAGKYSSPETSIEVKVSRNADGHVEFSVLDRGIGIDDSDLEELFAPFYRAASAAECATGMGLGLAVCRRIVEVHGGRISARRRPGGGSTFSFVLMQLDA